MYNIDQLNDKLLSELREIAETLGLKSYKKLAKEELIYKILDQQAVMPESELKKLTKVSKPTEVVPAEEAPKTSPVAKRVSIVDTAEASTSAPARAVAPRKKVMLLLLHQLLRQFLQSQFLNLVFVKELKEKMFNN